jgi:hypothetical protein
MKKDYDKPIFLDVTNVASRDQAIEDRYIDEIKRLCDEQAFGVLSAHGAEEASASLITFATSSAIDQIIFLTPRNTTKYDHILENNSVAILIDNRADHPDSINQISALTITGTATILGGGEYAGRENSEKWMDLFLKKHPNLVDFANAPSTVIVVVAVSRCVYVSKFQEVFEWNKV